MSQFLGESWGPVLEEEINQPYMQELFSFLKKEYEERSVYPPKDKVFSAFKETPYEAAKVVIVGQDPYHGHGQAHGLSFSVQPGVPFPPSLRNIFQEISSDIGPVQPTSGCLTGWTKQGVLLLNAILTVRAGEPASHQGKGWERFTDTAIQKLLERKERVVFLLWGKYAQEKAKKYTELAKKNGHVFLISPHPSPFSAHQGFLGCRHFSKANALLQEVGKSPINWKNINNM